MICSKCNKPLPEAEAAKAEGKWKDCKCDVCRGTEAPPAPGQVTVIRATQIHIMRKSDAVRMLACKHKERKARMQEMERKIEAIFRLEQRLDALEYYVRMRDRPYYSRRYRY